MPPWKSYVPGLTVIVAGFLLIWWAYANPLSHCRGNCIPYAPDPWPGLTVVGLGVLWIVAVLIDRRVSATATGAKN
jgi:hypothetical protein